MKYAEHTEVSSEKSQAEIKRTLQRYGATKYAYYEDEEKAAISFEFNGRRIRFLINLPDRTADEILYSRVNQSGAVRLRDVEVQHNLWEKACRQKWRALALAVKAKLEAVESGIATFEDEFLAYILLPSGQTVGEVMTPQIEKAYLTGDMPKLLLGITETDSIN